MAKKKDFRSLSTDEIRVEIDDARQELMNLRFQMSTGELTDYTRLRHTRRMIAQLLTIISERERKAE
jgi:large subunit ribosomal protein L29